MKRAPKPADRELWYEFRAQADDDPETAELHIFGPIGGGFFFDEDAVSGKKISQQLDELPESVKTIRVFVDSPGGSVTDAQHIANALRRQREELGRDVIVDILAAAWSAATIITSAGNPIRMPTNAVMMVHNPYIMAIGDADYMRLTADLLDKFKNTIIATYRWVSKLTVKQLGKLMDDETWMEADDALANGFVHEVTRPVEAKALFDPRVLNHLGDVPEEYRDRVAALVRDENDDAAGHAVEPTADEADEDPADDEPEVDSVDDEAAATEAEGSEADSPAPEDATASPAPAATVLQLCREGDCLGIAEGLIESGASTAEVKAQVARAKKITSLCDAAELPELADGYIASRMSTDAVREQVATIAARVDSAEIHGHIDPDSIRNSKPRIDINAVYAELNGVAPTQEK